MEEKRGIHDLFLDAVDAHRRGDLPSARRGYEGVLALDPLHIGALQNMGALHLASGGNDQAVDFFRRVLEREPHHAHALNNLGTALKNMGRSQEALGAFQEAVRSDPQLSDAFYNLGNLRRDLGEYPLALEAYRRTLALDPAHTDARNNLVATLIALGRLVEAEAACKEALAFNPGTPSGHYHMGLIRMREGRAEAAAECFGSALRISPSFSDAHLNLGSVRAGQGRMEEAVEAFQKALSSNPRSPNVYYNLGLAFERVGDLDREIATQEAALERCPDSPQSWIGAARALCKVADWGRAGPLLRRISEHPFSELEVSLLSSALFLLHAWPMVDQALFEKHLRWGDHMLRILERMHPGLSFDFARHRRETARLRIGYVSPDFCRHSVGWFFREIAFHHDPGAFEIHCYATERREDDLTAEIEGRVKSFSRVHAWDALQVADRIWRDGIHILVDLAGHTFGNRLDVFALRPAPVQVTMLGYPNGTGLRTMDYRITEHSAETAQSRACCLERHVYLPTGFLPFYPVRTAPALPGEGNPVLPRGRPVLISLNRAGKLRPEVLRLWDRILSRCPESVLALGCGPADRSDLRENILSSFQSEHRARVFFLPRVRAEEIHRARYLQACLALDPFPYAGTTTSYEALALGVPVVTLVGERHVQRTTYSLLSQLGLPEAIARSGEEYVDRAVALISRPGLRGEVRDRLRDSYRRRSERQGEEYTRALEHAYRTMWDRYREGKGTGETIDCA